jgi:PPOX class probable F420-dependent enzyme
MATFTDEQRAFLLHGTRTGKLATVRKDGRPHIIPIWFVLDSDDTIIFTTGESSVKAANMRRDARVSLCVDDENPPYAYITVEGTASWSSDLNEMLHWATRIAARYMGEDRAEAYGKRNATPGEMLVKIKPTKVVFLKDIAS